MNTKVAKALDTIATTVAGLDAIHKITNLGGVGADAALAGIRGVLAIVNDATSHPAGAITPASVDAELASLLEKLQGNDAAADSALDAKFSK